MSKQDHRPREKARELILDALVENPNGLTRTQIARAINRTKTPYLIKLIEELADDGFLNRYVKVFGNGVEGYIYVIAE